MRREYHSGMGFAFWRWTDVMLDDELYLRRLHIIQVPRIGAIMIHWIKKPDPQPDLHDHPVTFLSFVLKGWYVEYIPAGGKTSPYLKKRKIKWFNFVQAGDAHRIIETSEGGVVTLVFASPKLREWGFYTPKGWVFWKTYNETCPHSKGGGTDV